MDLWITSAGPVLDLHKNGSGQVVRLELTNKAKSTTPSGRSLAKGNYLVGNCRSRWATGVSEYSEVRSDLGQGLAIRYYFENGRPRYDLIMSPGADPSQCVFRIKGASSGTLDQHGVLKLDTVAGAIEQSGLYAYQVSNGRKVQVACRMVLHNKTLGFNLGAYDHSKALVIDPLIFCTYFGSGDFASLRKIKLDSNGNIWVTGTTNSPNYPATSGAYQTSAPNATASQIIAKLSKDGKQLIACTFLGGSGTDHINDLAVNASNQPVIVGDTSSADFPVTENAFQGHKPSPGSDSSAFVAVLSSDASQLLYSSFLGGTQSDVPTNGAALFDSAASVDLDSSGDAILTGQTLTTNFPVSPNAYQKTKTPTNPDAFVTILRLNGTAPIASTYFGGNPQTTQHADAFYTTGIAVQHDSLGNLDVVGRTRANTTLPVTLGAFQTTAKETSNPSYVAKFSPDLSALLGCSYLNGSLTTEVSDLKIASDDSLVITGVTFCPDYPYTSGAYNGGGSKSIGDSGHIAAGFVTCMAPDLKSLKWSSLIGPGIPHALQLDSSGNVIVAGAAETNPTYGLQYPTTAGAFMPSSPNAIGAFASKISADGSKLLYSTLFGGNLPLSPATEFGDQILGLAQDAAGNAYVAGLTASSDLPITPGAYLPYPPSPYIYQNQTGGLLGSIYSGFVAELNLTPNPFFLTIYPASVYGGANVTGTIKLASPAPTGGTTITLTPSGTMLDDYNSYLALQAPTTVTVPGGTSAKSFLIKTLPVAVNFTAMLTATGNGASVSQPLTINSAQPVSFTFNNTHTYGGSTGTVATVTMSAPLPFAGSKSLDQVQVTSNSQVAIANPDTVIPQPGQTVFTYPIKTTPVSTSQTVTFTAMPLNGVFRTATLIVDPAILASITTPNTTVAPGMQENVTIDLNGEAASGGAKVSLLSSAPSIVTVPSSVTVDYTFNSTRFPITVGNIAANQTVTITATLGNSSKTLTLTGSTVPLPIKFELSQGNSVPGGSSSKAYVTMSGKVSQQTTGTVSSSNTGVLTASPVTIVAGAQSGLVKFNTFGVAQNTQVTMTATVNGTSISTSLVVMAGVLESVSTAASSVAGGNSTTGQVSLTGGAPSAGTWIGVTSSDPSVKVPSAVKVPANASSVTFAVTTTAVTAQKTVTITASHGGITVTTTLTVTPS